MVNICPNPYSNYKVKKAPIQPNPDCAGSDWKFLGQEFCDKESASLSFTISSLMWACSESVFKVLDPSKSSGG